MVGKAVRVDNWAKWLGLQRKEVGTQNRALRDPSSVATRFRQILSELHCRCSPWGRMWTGRVQSQRFPVLGGWRGGFGVKHCWNVQQDDDRGQGGCSGSVKFLYNNKEGSLCWGPAFSPDWWGSRRLFCWRYAESWVKTACSSGMKRNGRRETGPKFFTSEWLSVGFYKRKFTLTALRLLGKQPHLTRRCSLGEWEKEGGQEQ